MTKAAGQWVAASDCGASAAGSCRAGAAGHLDGHEAFTPGIRAVEPIEHEVRTILPRQAGGAIDQLAWLHFGRMPMKTDKMIHNRDCVLVATLLSENRLRLRLRLRFRCPPPPNGGTRSISGPFALSTALRTRLAPERVLLHGRFACDAA